MTKNIDDRVSIDVLDDCYLECAKCQYQINSSWGSAINKCSWKYQCPNKGEKLPENTIKFKRAWED